MTNDPDEELVKRVAAGDQVAMQTMIARKLPRLLGLANRMLADPAEAEDVAQETFLRIWKHADGWRRGRARFDTWVHRVAINLCYDRLRRRRDMPMPDPPEQMDKAPLPDAGPTEHEEEGRRVDKALQALASRQREAIILVYYQDMSNQEAANVMHISVDALESLLARGRRSLQTMLMGDGDD